MGTYTPSPEGPHVVRRSTVEKMGRVYYEEFCQSWEADDDDVPWTKLSRRKRYLLGILQAEFMLRAGGFTIEGEEP